MTTLCTGSHTPCTRTGAFLHMLLSFLRIIIIDLPLASLFLPFVLVLVVRYAYYGYVSQYMDSYGRRDVFERSGDGWRLLPQFQHDMTYYRRFCDWTDITTTDSADLLVGSDSAAHAGRVPVDVMMKHGAVVLKDVLRQDTASELRRYLERRNREDLRWSLNFTVETSGRVSLGLGAGDSPIVAEALRQIGTNPTLKHTLEELLGPDPAIVEISTMTVLAGAEAQDFHSDADYGGSSLLYSRTFLHSYTMLIALQNTTASMGATSLCPGTHHCANMDLIDVCLENGAFEASSNGRTGPDDGMLLRGDAVLFNQNLWHRGGANQHNDTDRIMLTMAFAGRNKANAGDRRYQGLNTFYHLRWNQWGHTFSDLKDAGTVMVQPMAALRALGLWKPKSANWGVTWIEHITEKYRVGGTLFHNKDLPAFMEFLDSIGVPKFLQGDVILCKSESSRPWEACFSQVVENIFWFLFHLNIVVVGGYTLFGLVFWLVSLPFQAYSEPYEYGFIWTAAECALPWILVLTAVFGSPFKAINHFLLSKAKSWRIPPSWESFCENELGNISSNILLANVVVFGTCNIVVRFVRTNKSDKGMIPLWLPAHVIRILRLPTSLSLIAMWFIFFLRKTDIAQRATSGEIFERPFSSPDAPVNHSLPTALPERVDVLVGTRYDSEYLASFNRVLDYHPGNIRFQHLVSNLSLVPFLSVEDAAFHVVHAVHKRMEGMIPRFLLQCHKDGYWMVMNDGEEFESTRRSILMARNGVVRALGRTLKSIIADSRFGPLREKALARQFTPAFVKRWERVIFDYNGKTKYSPPRLPSLSSRRSSPPLVIRSRLHVDLRVCSVKSVQFLDTASWRKSRYAAMDLACCDGRDDKIADFRVGDKVVCKKVGGYDQARIKTIHNSEESNSEVFEIRYIATGEHDRVAAYDLETFEPFVEGTVVEGDTENNGTWFKGVITKVHPYDGYNVTYNDGYKEWYWGKEGDRVRAFRMNSSRFTAAYDRSFHS
mmetsp:Transcript_7089/g.14833  ORF Transcript_7089/g.14833 Transcript_7089/m.14833 type:complete len:998 (+) Transcript_7089:164-3157(+)